MYHCGQISDFQSTLTKQCDWEINQSTFVFLNDCGQNEKKNSQTKIFKSQTKPANFVSHFQDVSPYIFQLNYKTFYVRAVFLASRT